VGIFFLANLAMRSLVALLLLIASFSAVAQFNDSTFYHVHLGATGIINKTNETDSYVLRNNFKFGIEKKTISFNSGVSWIFGENQDVITNNDLSAAMDFNLYNKPPSNLYYWGLATYEKSVSLKINDRVQSGLGIGYDIVDRGGNEVIISDGILYEYSSLHDTPEAGVDTTYSTLRNSFRLKYRIQFTKGIHLDGTNFLQHSLSDRHDYIIKSQTNLNIKLASWLNFTAALTYNKLSATRRENLLFTFGFTAEKYF
jgi:hypothetical protein